MVGVKPRTSHRSLMEEIGDFTFKHIRFTDPVSVNRQLNMKQANVNSRQHSHARDDTTKHINITCSTSIYVSINKFHCK